MWGRLVSLFFVLRSHEEPQVFDANKGRTRIAFLEDRLQ